MVQTAFGELNELDHVLEAYMILLSCKLAENTHKSVDSAQSPIWCFCPVTPC